MSNQYDLSSEEIRKVHDRARLRANLRKEFLKEYQNPYKMARPEDGIGFDPQVQRWMSMRADHWQYFKPNPRTLIYPLGFIFAVFVYGKIISYDRDSREELIRTGEISPRDRKFRFN